MEIKLKLNWQPTWDNALAETESLRHGTQIERGLGDRKKQGSYAARSRLSDCSLNPGYHPPLALAPKAA